MWAAMTRGSRVLSHAERLWETVSNKQHQRKKRKGPAILWEGWWAASLGWRLGFWSGTWKTRSQMKAKLWGKDANSYENSKYRGQSYICHVPQVQVFLPAWIQALDTGENVSIFPLLWHLLNNGYWERESLNLEGTYVCRGAGTTLGWILAGLSVDCVTLEYKPMSRTHPGLGVCVY